MDELDEQAYEDAANTIVERTLDAFRGACREVGASGFQASWALMQVLWKGNGWDGPGIISRAENLVYPQYPPPSSKVREWETSEEVHEWVRDRAIELLTEHGFWRDGVLIEPEDEQFVSNDVLAHWKYLATEASDGG